MPFVAIAVAVFVALGGGVALSQAQPGDTLYEVKDSVKSALHINASTDVEARGNATSTAAHERNELRQESRATLEGSANANVHAGERANVHGSSEALIDINL